MKTLLPIENNRHPLLRRFLFDINYLRKNLGNMDSAYADYLKSLDLGYTKAQEEVTRCKNNQLGISGQSRFFTMDTANGKVRLIVNRTFVESSGKNTTYGINFSVLTSQ